MQLLLSIALAQVPNGDFSDGALDQLPPGWTVPKGSVEAGVSAVRTGEGTLMVTLDRGDTWGTVMTYSEAEPYRDQRIRLSARVRVETGRAQLWLREDTYDPELAGFFDNMGDRPVDPGPWQTVSIVAPLGSHGESLALGLIVESGTRAELDDVHIEVLGPADEGDLPPRALSDEELARLVALAEVSAAVRYFHPTDAVREVDWPRFQVAAIRTVEAESSLLDGLTAAFADLAPAVVFHPGDAPEPDALEGRLHRIEHVGLGGLFNSPTADFYRGGGPYRSSVQAVRRLPPEERYADLVLAEGVHARIPLALPAEALEVGSTAVDLDVPGGWEPSAGDRSSRQAAVMHTWAVFEYFLPYDTPVPWSEALEGALVDASMREDLAVTLRRMTALAGDGHASVVSRAPTRHRIPAELVFTERGLTVAHSHGSALEPGDIVIDPDVLAHIEQLRAETSVATAGDLEARLAIHATAVSPGEHRLRVVRDGEEQEVTVTATPAGDGFAAQSALMSGSEVAPGIVYIDLRGLDDLGPWEDAMRAAEGVIFDLRGYPGDAAGDMIRLLADKPVKSAYWQVPIRVSPTLEPTWDESRWTKRPKLRGLDAPAVILTDANAISWAETVMGIVEAYELAPIVGSPTAGTNGNVNVFSPLPGYTVSFTGMRVTKHDGTPHHGVGIQPTHPVSPTWAGVAAGRDEVLEAAIELLQTP